MADLDVTWTRNPCAVLVTRRKGNAWRFEPCGHPARYIVECNGDSLFSTCHRHNARIDRALNAKRD